MAEFITKTNEGKSTSTVHQITVQPAGQNNNKPIFLSQVVTFKNLVGLPVLMMESEFINDIHIYKVYVV